MKAVTVDKSNEQEDRQAVTVHNHTLSPRVSEYIKVLSVKHPFVKDVVLDKRDVLHELIGFWPDLPKWDAEARKIWAVIESTVLSVAASGTNERMLLQIRANSGPFSANLHTESDEAMALLAFDGIEGNVMSCIVPPMGDVPDLGDQHLLSGIILRCQPFPILIGKEHDTHLYSSKAGALYTSRTLDNPRSTNTFRGKSIETEKAEQDIRAQLDSENNAKLAAVSAFTAIAIDDIIMLEKKPLDTVNLEVLPNEATQRLIAQQQMRVTPHVTSPDINYAKVLEHPEEPTKQTITEQADLPTP